MLNRLKSTGGNKWVACCPVHEEKTPSLSIKQLDDRSYIMHCFGCGANGVDVFNTLGANKKELFGDKDNGDYIPQKVKDEYMEDKFFIAVYESDIKKGIKPKLDENRRYRKAQCRIRGIQSRWNIST